MTAQKESHHGLLATFALTAGVVVFGAYALDLHSHTCPCGHKWRHLGAFNLGDEASHTCARCGQVQWWKCGAPHVLQGSPGALPFGHAAPSPGYARAPYEEPPLCEMYGGHASSRTYEEVPPYRVYVPQPLRRAYEEPRPAGRAYKDEYRGYESPPPRRIYEDEYGGYEPPPSSRAYEDEYGGYESSSPSETPTYRIYASSPPSRPSEEAPAYGTQARAQTGRSYERAAMHRQPPAGPMRGQPSIGTMHRQPPAGPMRGQLPAGPAREEPSHARRLPRQSYERRPPSPPRARPSYERLPPSREYAALMPGTDDQEEGR